jgi:5-methylthioadenosine/S-adenosylhomocysteine deaminase
VLELRAAGVPVGLGTDGPAGSNNDFNLMEEMDLAAKLHKVTTMDPEVLPAPEALAMATIEGARALRMDQEIGSLEPGKRADLILLRRDAPHALPALGIYSSIVYSLKASDVETVIINGRLVVAEGRVLTLDEEEIREKAEEYATAVRAVLKRKP